MSIVTYTLHQCRRRCRSSKIVGALAFAFLLGCIFLRHSTQWNSAGSGLEFKWSREFLETFEQPTCNERRNFVYIKMIKCASSTLSAVFRRFGLERNLSFVLPPKNRIYIGWPYEVDHTHYRPSKAGLFNILCEHAVYNRRTMSRIMPSDTFYVTSIREPFSQVKSMLNYYNVFNISGVKSDNPLKEYLENMDRYEATYKSHDASTTRYCVPDGFSMTRNLMSYNLGFPTGFLPGTHDMSEDSDFIKAWIGRLDTEFQLVMITEYFHESLVLLRRLMCWGLQDILFSTSNQLGYTYRNQHDQTLVEKYRQWSKVDYILYNHFNESLWKRLRNKKEEFWNEVQHFRRLNKAVNNYCDNPEEAVAITIPQSTWYDKIVVSTSFCKLLHEDLLKRLHENYNKMKPQLEEPQPSKHTC